MQVQAGDQLPHGFRIMQPFQIGHPLRMTRRAAQPMFRSRFAQIFGDCAAFKQHASINFQRGHPARRRLRQIGRLAEQSVGDRVGDHFSLQPHFLQQPQDAERAGQGDVMQADHDASSRRIRGWPASTWVPAATSTSATLPARPAVRVCSIFIASRTANRSPAATS